MPRVWFYLRVVATLCASASLCSPAGQAQSLDDVHIIPRHAPEEQKPKNAPTTIDIEPKLRPMKPMRVDVDLVVVPVTVTDALNRPVMGLEKQNFKLYEGEQQQEITQFSADDSPISIGLLLDLSKSMTNKYVIERAAVEAFFQNANPQDDYFVIAFSDKPRVLATSTQSIEDIQEKLAADVPDGETALLDAVYLALAKMRSARYSRRALLVISDGGDNHSRYGMKEVKSLVQEANVEVYAIGIFDSTFFRSFEEFMGKRWLGAITDVTGGRTIAAGDLGKVPEIAATVSREMRSEYVLGYRPRNNKRDGKWRRIRVEVNPSPGAGRVQAYYKRGYLAGPR
jgi:Ca-activated chloride channel family protein